MRNILLRSAKLTLNGVTMKTSNMWQRSKFLLAPPPLQTMLIASDPPSLFNIYVISPRPPPLPHYHLHHLISPLICSTK